MNLIWLGFGESLTALHVCIVSCSSNPNFTMGAHYILPTRWKEEKRNPFSRSEIRNGGGVGGLVVRSSFSELSLST